MNKSLDFQKDSIVTLIIKTSLPLILASVVTMVVQLANITFMGNVGTTDIYIRSLYTPFAFLTIAFTEAFQISNQVVISRLKGSDKYDSLRQSLINFIFLSLTFSLLLMLLIYISAPYIASYYQVPDEIAPLFISFLRVMFLVNSLVVLTMVLTSALRGYGNVNLSVLLNIIYALLNVSLVYYFAFHLNQGITSIVYANLISSIVTIFVSTIVLFKKRILQLRKKYFTLYKQALLFLRNVGLPISLSYLIIFISNFFFNKIVAPFGVEAISGFGVAYYIQTFVIVPGIAIGSSLGIIMNNNIGGGIKYFERVYESYRRGVILTISFYFILTSVIYIFHVNILSIMLDNQLSISYASDFISIIAPSYLIMGVVLMTITTLEQINKGVTALVLNSLYFAIITLVGWFLTRLFDDLSYFYWTFFTVNLLGITCVIYTWNLIKREYGSSKGVESMNELGLVRYDETKKEDICTLYTQLDFYFKSYIPNYLSEDDLLTRINENTILIEVNGKTEGLVEFEEIMDAAFHYQIHFRMSNKYSMEEVENILSKVIASFVLKTKVNKLAAICYEMDSKYIKIFEKNQFEIEGTLPNLINVSREKNGEVRLHKPINDPTSQEMA